MAGYEIPLDMPGLGAAVDRMHELRDATKQTRAEVRGLRGDLDSLGGARFRGSGSPGRSVGGSPSSSSSSGGSYSGGSASRSSSARGPFARHQQALRDLDEARRRGASEDELRDLRYRETQARKSKERAEYTIGDKQKSREDLIKDAFATSRVGPDGKLYPLVGKLIRAGLMDPSKMMGEVFSAGNIARMAPLIGSVAGAAVPFAIGAAGASAAVAGLRFGIAGAENMRPFRSAYFGSGAGAAVSSTMLALGGSGSTQTALSLADALRQGSFGAGYMRSRGIADLGQYQTDKGTNYVRVIDELRKVKSDQVAIRVARDLGMVDELKYRDLSDRTYSRLKSSMYAPSPFYRKQAQELDSEREILGNRMAELKATAAQPFIVGSNVAYKATNFGLENIDRLPFIGTLVNGMRTINAAVQGGSYFFGEGQEFQGGIKKWRRKWLGEGGGLKDETPASKEHTDALRENTRALKDHAESIGGGARMAGALNGRVSSWFLQAQLDDKFTYDAINLGAFSVN